MAGTMDVTTATDPPRVTAAAALDRLPQRQPATIMLTRPLMTFVTGRATPMWPQSARPDPTDARSYHRITWLRRPADGASASSQTIRHPPTATAETATHSPAACPSYILQSPQDPPPEGAVEIRTIGQVSRIGPYGPPIMMMPPLTAVQPAGRKPSQQQQRRETPHPLPHLTWRQQIGPRDKLRGTSGSAAINTELPHRRMTHRYRPQPPLIRPPRQPQQRQQQRQQQKQPHRQQHTYGK